MKTSRMDWKVGAASCIFKDQVFTLEDLSHMVAKGVTAMEMDMQNHWSRWPVCDLKNAWQHIGNHAKGIGLTVWSLHIPFGWDDDLSSLREYHRKAIVARHSALIVAAKETLGIEKAVVHPSFEPIPENEREERIKRVRESLSDLCDGAEKVGVQVAVEDLPRSCLGNTAEEMLRIIDGIDKLGVCCDTNHLLTERTEDFIRALGSRIATVHLSDYDFINERHWLPGKGLNDWETILAALEDAGYSGPAMFEVGPDFCPAGTKGVRKCWDKLIKR